MRRQRLCSVYLSCVASNCLSIITQGHSEEVNLLFFCFVLICFVKTIGKLSNFLASLKVSSCFSPPYSISTTWRFYFKLLLKKHSFAPNGFFFLFLFVQTSLEDIVCFRFLRSRLPTAFFLSMPRDVRRSATRQQSTRSGRYDANCETQRWEADSLKARAARRNSTSRVDVI